MSTSRSFRHALVLVGLLLAPALVSASETALWIRYPAISPDGATIAFSYRGDLWTVPAAGGVATPLTMNEAYEFAPVWSPDGSRIAFASDRYGNFDVYVVAATGGPTTRLTFHSSDDIPTSFTPDGKSVLFSSARLDSVTNVQFPTRAQPELYRVALTGGMPEQILTTPAEYAVWNRAGTTLAYSDRKGYEMPWRKHDDSSFARDVWIYDAASGKHTRLTQFGHDDRQPVWSPDEKSLYYLSEASGSFNVWRLDLAHPDRPEQVTKHSAHPARFLSISSRGDLCYTWNGELWVRPAGAAESRKLTVEVTAEPPADVVEWTDVGDQLSEFDVSPSGKEIAFIARGEVFVTATDFGVTKRITSTPEQERSVSFSPDGRSLIYASERDGSWNLYRSDLTDPNEPSFFNATAIVERPVLVTKDETFQPLFSPDGKQVAYLENRTTLKVLDLASGKSHEVLPGDRNYSYTDGDQWFRWSPDGKWLLVTFLSDGRWSSEAGLVPSDGKGDLVNLTKSGYEDDMPRFSKDGTTMYWATDRQGMRRHAGYGGQKDIYAMFLTEKSWDRFNLTQAEYEQAKAREKKDKKGKEKGEKEEKGKEEASKEGAADEEAPKLAEPVAYELTGLVDRTVRLTHASANLADAELTPDGETLVYLARFEKGFDLWVAKHRKDEIKLLAKLDAERVGGLAIDSEGKKAFVLADHKLVTVDLEGGKVQPVRLQAKMELDRAAERAYLFEHIWRQTKEKFYVASMHGVDWDAMKTYYARFLPHISNNEDFAELISEMQGELDSSHSGGRYRPHPDNADETAALGFFPDPAHHGPGVAISEVIEGGPLTKAGLGIAPGAVIESIDGSPIADGADWYPLLNHKAGTLVRLSLHDPKGDRDWQVTVKPVDQREESELLYQRWVRSRRDEVDRLSKGRLGYAHIRGMNDASYREVFEEIFGRAVGKEAIILDTRFNGGGNLDEALTTFLTGKVFFREVPRGRQVGSDPELRWTKPSIVIVNEGNYSDAHCFPEAYTELGIGETVGMPVPGTCTAVWWEHLQDPTLIFGIPQVGIKDNSGDYLERKQLVPNHEVDNDPQLEAQGRDQQLEEAVKVMLEKLDAAKK
ncbi:MAG TPA: S41 family peptidase [Candidatus Saccharimonadales bacterium]|nr:S41 family peptidase [Candidatus Saccharimonadales bacterium]